MSGREQVGVCVSDGEDISTLRASNEARNFPLSPFKPTNRQSFAHTTTCANTNSRSSRVDCPDEDVDPDSLVAVLELSAFWLS